METFSCTSTSLKNIIIVKKEIKGVRYMACNMKALLTGIAASTLLICSYTAGFKQGYTEDKDKHARVIQQLNNERLSLVNINKDLKNKIADREANISKLRAYIEELKTNNKQCKIDRFVVTAYSPYENVSGIENNGDASATSTGVIPRQGTIAVDPRVIPYGSTIVVLYEDGSSYIGRAEDCGGAIKGKRLDVFKQTYKETTQHGKKRATVVWW